ncbi:unnamed protein product, partial [Cylindrotheca closterium]
AEAFRPNRSSLLVIMVLLKSEISLNLCRSNK